MDDSLDETLERLRASGRDSDVAPAFLLADSRLLFGRLGEGSFAERVASCFRDAAWMWGPRAAYLGAGNDDRPEFYEIFEAFAESAGCKKLCHVHATPSEEERDFLAEADLVVLGGGDPLKAWRALEAAELVEVLRKGFVEGSVHLGVSAGATLLGLGSLDDEARFVSQLGVVPLVVGTGEGGTLEALRSVVQAAPFGRGIGIPAGGGAIFHPDGSLEPVAATLQELHRDEDGALRPAQLLPPATPSSPTDERLPS